MTSWKRRGGGGGGGDIKRDLLRSSCTFSHLHSEPTLKGENSHRRRSPVFVAQIPPFYFVGLLTPHNGQDSHSRKKNTHTHTILHLRAKTLLTNVEQMKRILQASPYSDREE